jgi:putative hemolysin
MFGMPMLLVELAVVLSLIVVNGLLAMSELAIISSRQSRLKAMVEREVHGSRRALALATDPGRFLSTVQFGITLVGVLAGAFSGATIGDRFSEWLVVRGMPQGIADPLAIGVVVTAITYLSLIIGELVPKRVALRNPESVACTVAPAMAWLSRAAARPRRSYGCSTLRAASCSESSASARCGAARSPTRRSGFSLRRRRARASSSPASGR